MNAITIADIQHETARYYALAVETMWHPRRDRKAVRPRQIAMALAREMTPRSLPEIGAHFGGRDHTTVLHAVKTIRRLRAGDAEINTAYLAIAGRLTGDSAPRVNWDRLICAISSIERFLRSFDSLEAQAAFSSPSMPAFIALCRAVDGIARFARGFEKRFANAQRYAELYPSRAPCESIRHAFGAAPQEDADAR